jgi:hypothetical protein
MFFAYYSFFFIVFTCRNCMSLTWLLRLVAANGYRTRYRVPGIGIPHRSFSVAASVSRFRQVRSGTYVALWKPYIINKLASTIVQNKRFVHHVREDTCARTLIVFVHDILMEKFNF